jgi:CheY-like chemotaxis protein
VSPVDFSDRRRQARARDLDMTAVVRGENGDTGSFVVENLSSSGARLVGAIAFGEGERVAIALSGDGMQTIELAAEVVRAQLHDASWAVAVRFRDLPDPIHDTIQRVVMHALARQRLAARKIVMVVDDERAIQVALSHELTLLGLEPHAVATPRGVVGCLQDPSLEVHTAFVDLGLGVCDGLDVVAYLAEAYPGIHRVVMSGAREDDLRRAVASGKAHAMLRKPWDRSDLRGCLKTDS